MGEGGGFGWGGVEGWGENADNCNWITIKVKKESYFKFLSINLTVWRFLRKLEIDLLYDTVILLLGLSEENKNTKSKRYMHPYVHCSTIYKNQDMEAI